MKVPVLSVWQPWASLLVSGVKNYENRRWKLSEKFLNKKIYIHASLKKDCFEFEIADEHYRFFMNNKASLSKELNDYKFGGIIGWVVFDKVVTESESMWFSGPYSFHVKEFKQIEFIPLKGHQGIFYSEIEENNA